MKVALYCRVSTQEQAMSGHSIEEQQDRLQKFCEAFGWNDVQMFTDAGFSGANVLRPALQSLIKAVQTHKVDKVLVYKLDRLSRSQKDTLMLIEDVFLANGCDFVSISENFDTSTAFGRAMVGILAVFAQLEREQIKERMSMGRQGRAKQGKFHGSNMIPIGYDYIEKRLTVNEFEAMQVKRIFELYCAGKSPYKIAEELNQSGLIHKYGQWLPMTVSDCISKQTYLGKIVHNGNIYEGEHDAIIDQDLFDRANALKTQKSEEHASKCLRRGRIKSFLGGLLYCAHCGAKYSKATKRSKGFKYDKYICYSRWKNTASLVRDPNCQNKIWDMQELNDIVFDEIKKLSLEPSTLDDIISKDDGQIDVVTAEIKKKDEQIERLMDLYALGQFPVDLLQEKVQTINEQKEKLEDSLHKLMDAKTQRISHDRTKTLIESFADVLEQGDFDEIRLVLESLIDRIDLDGEDVIIHWNF